MAEHSLEIGDPVVFVDTKGRALNALVTFPHGPTEWEEPSEAPSINVAYVEPDAGRDDSWGRQIGRSSSVPFSEDQKAEGYYWRFPD